MCLSLSLTPPNPGDRAVGLRGKRLRCTGEPKRGISKPCKSSSQALHVPRHVFSF
jgi:hypothetical protein